MYGQAAARCKKRSYNRRSALQGCNENIGVVDGRARGVSPRLPQGPASRGAAPRSRSRASREARRPEPERVDRHARRLGQRGHPAQGRGLRPAPALQGGAVRPAGDAALRDRPAPVPRRAGAGAGRRWARPRRSSPRPTRTSSGSRRWPPSAPSASRSWTTRLGRPARRARRRCRRRARRVDQAALNLGWTRVTSPIDGIVGIARTQVGDLVEPADGHDHGLDRRPHPGDLRHQRAGVHATARRASTAPPTRPPRQARPCDLILDDGTVFPEPGAGRPRRPRGGPAARAP